MRRLRNSLFVLTAVLVTGLALLLGTGAGFRLLLSAADALGPASITVADSTGSLARGVRVRDLRVITPAISLSVADTSLDMALLPLLVGRVEIARLHLDGVEAVAKTAAGEGTDGQPAALPVTIVVDDLRVSRLAAVDPEGQRFELENINLTLEAGAGDVRFSGLSLYSDVLAVHGSGRLRYLPSLRMNAELDWTLEQSGGLAAVSARTRIDGDAANLGINTLVAQPLDARLDVTISDLMKRPEWQARLDTGRFDPRGLFEQAPDLRLAVSLQASGDLAALNARGQMVLSGISVPGTEIRAGGDDSVTLGIRLDGRRDDNRYRAEGEINWEALAVTLPQQYADLAVPAGRLALSLQQSSLRLHTETPFTFNERQGGLKLAASGSTNGAELETLDIRLGDGRLHAEGTVDTSADDGLVRFTADWQGLGLAAGGEFPLRSPRGELRLQGRPDAYRLSANARLQSSRLPDVTASIDAEGDLEQLQIRPLKLSLFNGTMTATGSARWAQPLRVDLNWQGQGLDPGRQWPDWPGELALDGRTVIDKPGKDYRYTINDLKVRGRVRDRPFALDLDSVISGGSVRLHEASATSGRASVLARGELSRERADLQWRLDIPDLGVLVPDTGGRIEGRGSYAGKPARPVISGELTAGQVTSPWLNLDGLDADVDIDLTDKGRIDVDTEIDTLAYGDVQVRDLQLRVKGSAAAHDYRLSAENETSRLNLAGQGDYRDGSWQGRTRDLTFTHAQFGTWQLRRPTVTRIEGRHIKTGDICLGRDTTDLCLRAVRTDSNNWNAGVDIDAMPVTIARPWYPYFLDADGTFDADLTVAASRGRISGRGDVRLDPAGIDFRIDEDEVQRFEVNGGSAGITLQDGRLNGQMQLDFADLATPVRAGITLTGLADGWPQDPAAVSLRGDLSGRVDDLGFIATLTPYLTDTRGSLAVDLQASGSLAGPELAGDISLDDTAFHAPDLGVAIDRMNIRGQATDTGVYRFSGQWYSGEGIARIDGSLKQTGDGLALTADVTGENTEIINLPEIQALASPDLQLEFMPGRKSARGEIRITSALIDLDEVTTKTPVSGDVVIVKEQDSEAPKAQQENLRTDLGIRFGDDIRIRGQGITGKLGGGLDITNNNKGQFIANGEVNIREGAYSAYGQSLNIEEGRLIYRQYRLDNPEVRIRATRQVDDVTAGVRISGYLSNPTVTLFSTPAMNQEQILSYIVFGRPLDSLSSGEGSDLIGAATSLGLQNSGFITSSLANTFGLDEFKVKTRPGAGTQDASLVVGKYLTPRLYLSYGIGLFESINTATIRYDISKRWAIEAQQGEEVGADLLYKIER